MEMAKWKEAELSKMPKFRGKEALVNTTIEKLIVKAAEYISEASQNTYSTEMKYIFDI
jgi:hypothetical protein